MKKALSSNKAKVDYYTANHDSNGKRTVIDAHEIIRYRDNSSIRIWYNEQTIGYDAHWHTALEIIMPIENFYDVETMQTSYHLNPGEILLISPGEIHRLVAPTSGTRFIYLFDVTLIDKLRGFSSILALSGQCVLINHYTYAKIYDDICQILNQIRKEYFAEREYADITIFSLLLKLYSRLGYFYLEQNPFPDDTLNLKGYAKRFNDILDYIDTHYIDNLTLEGTAALAGFSKFYFSRLFKQYTRMTFNEYLIFRRLKAAEELLTDLSLPITEVSLQAGFTSISTFNRVFKSNKRCTPSEYRSRYTTAL